MMHYEHIARNTARPYYTPEDFLAEAVKYFRWCDDHPLQEEKVFMYQGAIVRADQEKVRAYTKRGLAIFLNLTENKLQSYKSKGGKWADAVEMIEQVIYTQKFENAAAGLLNPSMISRDLGLADRQELSGVDGSPIRTEEVTPRERITGRLASLAARASKKPDTGGA